jgi:hypothetical protein
LAIWLIQSQIFGYSSLLIRNMPTIVDMLVMQQKSAIAKCFPAKKSNSRDASSLFYASLIIDIFFRNFVYLSEECRSLKRDNLNKLPKKKFMVPTSNKLRRGKHWIYFGPRNQFLWVQFIVFAILLHQIHTDGVTLAHDCSMVVNHRNRVLRI